MIHSFDSFYEMHELIFSLYINVYGKLISVQSPELSEAVRQTEYHILKILVRSFCAVCLELGDNNISKSLKNLCKTILNAQKCSG